MIWAALLLVVALAAPAVWAWYMSGRQLAAYMSGRQLAARTEAEQWRVARLALAVSAGVGVVILVLGVVFFVLTGYDWLVLAPIWSFGLFHLGVLTWMLRRVKKATGKAGAAR